VSAPRRNARETIALAAYQLAVNIVLPLGVLLGAPFFALSEKRRATVFRRAGFQPLPRFSGRPRPLWIHALSLGETLSAVGLVRALRQRLPDRPIVLSTSTRQGRVIAEQRLAGVVDAFIYFPFDMIPATARALDALDPAMIVFIETDIWPGFLASVRRRGIPALLVNGRLSPRTFASVQRWNWLFGPTLRTFSTLVPQSEGEAERYRAAGVRDAQLTAPGNLKFDVASGSFTAAEAASLRRELRVAEGQPLWLAGSTHPGEEELILRVFKLLQASQRHLRLVLVPRHPGRADEVVGLCRAAGSSARKLTEAGAGADGTEVVVVDVMGRLAQLYHLATVAFVGGSLAPKGGQSPIEPAAAGVPVVFGPHMSAFPDISRALLAGGAAIEVADEASLLTAMRGLLGDPPRGSGMGERGRRLVESSRGTTARVVELIAARVGAADAQRA